MGCCSARGEYEQRLEENLITSFENKLGFGVHDYRTIKLKIIKLSPYYYLTQEELVNMFIHLSICPYDFKEFYKYFLKKNNFDPKQKKYSLHKLNSLFLLLCKDTVKKKAKIWASLYERKSDTLTKNKVDKMVKNILKVSTEFALNYICSIYKDNENLIEYHKLINKGKYLLLETISKKLRNNKPEVNIEVFKKNCLIACGSELFNPSFLRYRAYLQGLKIQSAKNYETLEKIKRAYQIPHEEVPIQIPRIHHKKSNSQYILNKFKLFNAEKIDKKENLRYQDSRLEQSIIERRRISDISDTNEKSLNYTRTEKIRKIPIHPSTTKAQHEKEVGIKRIFYKESEH